LTILGFSVTPFAGVAHELPLFWLNKVVFTCQKKDEEKRNFAAENLCFSEHVRRSAPLPESTDVFPCPRLLRITALNLCTHQIPAVHRTRDRSRNSLPRGRQRSNRRLHNGNDLHSAMRPVQSVPLCRRAPLPCSDRRNAPPVLGEMPGRDRMSGVRWNFR
jgi:hypothetical protein